MTQWGLDTLFNPAKRHMDDEKRRLQSTREEVGDNSGGNRINLESGKVTIRKQDDEAGTDATDAVTAERAATERPAKADETPAQARARARREAARAKNTKK